LTGYAGLSSYLFNLQGCTTASNGLQLDLYLAIEEQSFVFILPRSEMGQDIVTTFAMLIAEELDAPLDKIHLTFADASEKIPNQMTVGSSSTRIWWETMRQIGADLRMLLINEAAARTDIPVSDLVTNNGEVVEPQSGLRLPYHELAKHISPNKQALRAPLKEPEAFKLIGRNHNSLFNREKITGQYIYLADRKTKQLKVVNVAYRADWLKPTKNQIDTVKSKYRLVKAFLLNTRIGGFSSFAVLCHQDTWPVLQAKQELEGLKRKALSESGPSQDATSFDKTIQSLAQENQVGPEEINLTFTTPPVAHAPMEPPCASMQYSPDKVEVWAPTQAPDFARRAVAKTLAIAEQDVILHTVPMGGAFGRKRYTDYLEELAACSKALYDHGVSDQIQLFWDRSDDLCREHYRTATAMNLRWRNKQPNNMSLSLYEGYAGANSMDTRLPLETEIPIDMDIAAQKRPVEHRFSSGIWRSVHHGYLAFSLASMIDELCHLKKRDPIDFYLERQQKESFRARVKSAIQGISTNSERCMGVIKTVSQMADWSNASSGLNARGFSVYSCFGSFIALIAEIRIDQNESLIIEKIWASIDCGLAINPDKVKAQLEGGILYGLGACLFGDIPKDKDLKEMNFDRYQVLRMRHAPEINIDIRPSNNPPTGAGELGVPVIAPAVCNAIRRLRPFRMIRLPIIKNGSLNYDSAFNVSPESIV